MEGLLNKYSTKSTTEIRSAKSQLEKDQQDKLYEDRIYKPPKDISSHFDTQWLRKSFYRCKEQSATEGTNLITLLRDRYDDKTIDFMMSTFGGHTDRNNHSSHQKNYNDRHKNDNDRQKNDIDRQKYDNDRQKNGYDRQKNDNNRQKNDYDRQKNQTTKYDHSQRYDSDNKRQANTDNDHSHRYDSDNKRQQAITKYDTEQESHHIVEERYVTEIDINEACASLMRAEISGNVSKIAKLQKRVDTLREAKRRNLKVRLTQLQKVEPQRTVMIEKTLKSGKMIPYLESANQFVSQSRPYDRVSTSLADLVREERALDADESDLAFARMSGRSQKGARTADDAADCEYNDAFVQRKPAAIEKQQTAAKQQAIAAQKQRTATVARCKRCYESLPKHLVLSKGEYWCVAVPPDCGITECHVQLVPLDHVASCANVTDEDAWAELELLQRRVTRFFREQLDAEAVFLETVTGLQTHPHTAVDCVPVPRDRDNGDVDTAVFFQKALAEAKSDWCQNRGVLKLATGGIRRTVPRGFAYFCVQLEVGREGNAGGFALVIEDEARFSANFGIEIVGSLLGKDLIEINDRRPKSFNEQADRALRYEHRWKRYDPWPVSADSD